MWLLVCVLSVEPEIIYRSLVQQTSNRHLYFLNSLVCVCVCVCVCVSSLQVGAAISMTYTTGQPIVFVGTGQKYVDLKSLNVHAVVSALLK